jgi:hypothetical protein
LCTPCQIKDFTNWTSDNEKIDKFIREKQLEVERPQDLVFEWIPYEQFDGIKKINESNFFTTYLAIWKDGLLYWNVYNKKYMRNLNTKVALKCFYNTQNITDFLNEV